MSIINAKNMTETFLSDMTRILNQSDADAETKELIKQLATKTQRILKEIVKSID